MPQTRKDTLMDFYEFFFLLLIYLDLKKSK